MKRMHRIVATAAVIGAMTVGSIALAAPASADPLGDGDYIGHETYSNIEGTDRIGIFRWMGAGGGGWVLWSCTPFTTVVM